MKIVSVIAPSDEPLAFKTLAENGKRRPHALVAWRFFDDGTFEPVLLPPPAKGAELVYEVGQTNPALHKWER